MQMGADLSVDLGEWEAAIDVSSQKKMVGGYEASNNADKGASNWQLFLLSV